MSTTTGLPAEARASSLSRPGHPAVEGAAYPGEQRIVLTDVSWDVYERVSDAIREGSTVYLAYDGRDLELMTTGMIHDDFKDIIGRFVNAVTFELAIPCKGTAQVTWNRPEIELGIAADQSYYFAEEQLEMAAKSRMRRSNQVADYPNPDLAIEIDISPSRVDRAGIYAALGVSEFWRFNGELLRIGLLEPDGRYATSASSRFLPVEAHDVSRWLLEEIGDVNSRELRPREWIRAEVLPRKHG